MDRLRILFSEKRLSSKALLLGLLFVLLFAGSVTYASYYYSEFSLGSNRAAAFDVSVTTEGIDIESGTAGASSWGLELFMNDPETSKVFTVNNKSEVTVQCVPSIATSSPPLLVPIATFSPPGGITLAPGESGTITLGVKPAVLGVNEWQRVDEGSVTFSIVQVD